MGEVLFLAHRMPFPPDRGDKIRSSHVLRHLATLAPVHVATFAESDQDLADEPQLAAVSATHCLVRRTKPVPLAGVEALLKHRPVSLTAFHSAQLDAYVRAVLANHPVDTISDCRVTQSSSSSERAVAPTKRAAIAPRRSVNTHSARSYSSPQGLKSLAGE